MKLVTAVYQDNPVKPSFWETILNVATAHVKVQNLSGQFAFNHPLEMAKSADDCNK